MATVGWGGWINGSLTGTIRGDFNHLIPLLAEKGYSNIRPHSQRPWQTPSSQYPRLSVEDWIYVVELARQHGLTVFVNACMNYPPSDYLAGHWPEWRDFWYELGTALNSYENVVLEVVNEWEHTIDQQEYGFNWIIDLLRNYGVTLPVLCNYYAKGSIRPLNDPLNNYMVGNHFYGAFWDNTPYPSTIPVDRDVYAAQASGTRGTVTEWLHNHFTTGQASEAINMGIPYAVTELGCSWNHANTCIQGGYVMNPANLAFVMGYVDRAIANNVHVCLHRIGDYQDLECYEQYAREWFDEAFYMETAPEPPEPECYTREVIDYCAGMVGQPAAVAPICDVNNDGVIDMRDMAMMTRNVCPEEPEPPVQMNLIPLIILGVLALGDK